MFAAAAATRSARASARAWVGVRVIPGDAAVGERGQDLAQPAAFQGVQPAVDAVHPAQGFGQADATFGALGGVVGVGGLRVALPDQQGQDPAQLDRFHPGSQVHQGGFDLVEPGDPGGGVAQRLHMRRAQPPVPERRSHVRQVRSARAVPTIPLPAAGLLPVAVATSIPVLPARRLRARCIASAVPANATR